MKKIIVDSIKGYYYDSYSGLDKFRLVVTGTILGVLCIIVGVVVYIKSLTEENLEELVENIQETLEPKNVLDKISWGLIDTGIVEQEYVLYDEPDFESIKKAETDVLGKRVEAEEEEEVEEEYVGVELEGYGGSYEGEGEVEVVEAKPGKYTTYQTAEELQSLVRSSLIEIRGLVLRNTKETLNRNSWESLRDDMRLNLGDIELLGDQIEEHLGEDLKSTWSEFEPRYVELYNEVSVVDSYMEMKEIVDGERYSELLEDTGELIIKLKAGYGLEEAN